VVENGARAELTLTTPNKTNTQLPKCLGVKVAADSLVNQLVTFEWPAGSGLVSITSCPSTPFIIVRDR
jgi:hypothetical protein